MGTTGIGLDDDRRAGLLVAIRRKRASVDEYVRTADTRRHRMLTTTIVAGALAATLTAAPALGGKSFSDWLTGLFGWEAPAWRMLCAAAALASLTATVTTQLMRADNLDQHLASAQAHGAKLEALETAVATGQLTYAKAVAAYTACVEGLAFVETPPRRED